MTLKRRIVLFAIGIVLGIMAVGMFFPGYNWLGWLPSNAIKSNINKFPIECAEKASCKLACVQMDQSRTVEIIRDGEVIYDKSETKTKPRRYHIELGAEYVYVTLEEKKTIVENYSNGSTTEQCDCPK
jgi:hypothetical protein